MTLDLDLGAETARSILACPTEVELVVDGVPHPLADDGRVGLQDWSGTPTIACSPGGTLSRAAQDGCHAILTLASDLQEGHTLTLAGELRRAGTETCGCCDDVRDYVVIDLSFVLLAHGEERVQVDPADFADPALQLNAGFLLRSEEHLNDCHADHLRHAVAQRTGVPVREVAGVRLLGLGPRSVELQWVTAAGAHRTVLRFAHPARTADELGALLRRSLHPGLC